LIGCIDQNGPVDGFVRFVNVKTTFWVKIKLLIILIVDEMVSLYKLLGASDQTVAFFALYVLPKLTSETYICMIVCLYIV